MNTATVRQWLDAVAGFVYPEVCQICQAQRATPAAGYVCANCWQGVRFVTPPFCERCGLPFEGEITHTFECTNCREMELHFSSARAAVIARGVVLEVIHRYKYQQALWFEPFLVDLLLRTARPELERKGWDLVVPVPLHPLKEREREFNQAARIARQLANAMDLPVETRAVIRREFTRTQTQLTRSERAENMRGAFEPNANIPLRGRRIVLVDDVLTTGATTSACARALLRAGAAEVCVWTVARGI